MSSIFRLNYHVYEIMYLVRTLSKCRSSDWITVKEVVPQSHPRCRIKTNSYMRTHLPRKISIHITYGHIHIKYMSVINLHSDDGGDEAQMSDPLHQDP